MARNEETVYIVGRGLVPVTELTEADVTEYIEQHLGNARSMYDSAVRTAEKTRARLLRLISERDAMTARDV
jgi:hypothetical protein